MTTPIRRATALALVAGLAFTAAACGGDYDESPPAATATAEPTGYTATA